MAKGKRNAIDSSSRRQALEPFTLVIFGASGDLNRRKLIPAVYSLFSEGLLPDGFSVVGFARREKTDDSFRGEMRDALKAFARTHPFEEKTWAAFAPKLHYH